MLYALGFGDGAVVRVVRHPDREDLRGHSDGRAARQVACARFAAEVGHEPTILRAESGGEVFVFGSNLAGRHGRGAALEARRAHGAESGVGSGPTGRAYAIPTKDERLNSLPLPVIACHVRAFVAYAESRPSDRFRVTRVGCGLAGYVDAQIAPMFSGAPQNCDLPDGWRGRIAEHEAAVAALDGHPSVGDWYCPVCAVWWGDQEVEAAVDHLSCPACMWCVGWAPDRPGPVPNNRIG